MKPLRARRAHHCAGQSGQLSQCAHPRGPRPVGYVARCGRRRDPRRHAAKPTASRQISASTADTAGVLAHWPRNHSDCPWGDLAAIPPRRLTARRSWMGLRQLASSLMPQRRLDQPPQRSAVALSTGFAFPAASRAREDARNKAPSPYKVRSLIHAPDAKVAPWRASGLVPSARRKVHWFC
jgi:hypothetical protein